MKKYIFILLSILLSATSSFGAVSWTGNTCTITGDATVAQITDCLTGAVNGIVANSKTGEITVQLPADSETWSTTLVINMTNATYINVTKLTIQGAGMIPAGSTKGSASSGGTTINVTATSAISITGSTSKKFRITNIHWTGGVQNTGYFIRFNGTSLPSSGGGFRVDHNTWTDFESRVRKVTTQGRIYGVIDHNYVYGPTQYNMFGDVGESSGYGGNKSWYRGIDINSIDQVYFEDNELVNTLSTQYSFVADCVNGGRLVARYNTITNYYFGGHGLGGMRSCLSQVIHNNAMYTTNVSPGGADPSFSFRDGTAIVYNNTITETRSGVSVTNSMWSNPIIVRDYRSAFNVCTGYAESWNHGSPHDLDCDGDAASLARKVCYNNIVEQPRTCTQDSDCGTGAPENSCYKVDFGTSGTTGYPCRDQMGYTSTGGVGDAQMVAYPSLFANNKRNGVEVEPYIPSTDTFTGCGGTTLNDNHIVKDRDFCHHATTLPATCNSIATTYSAYTYPHPLVGGATDTTDPNDLTSLSPTGQQACATNPSNVAISLSATDNVAVTGVRCCLENGSTCTSATAYASRGVVLSNTSGTTWGATVSSACDSDILYNCMSTDGTNYSNNGVISYQMADNSDTTAPTMSTQAIGADGRTVTFTFSEAVTIGAGGSAGFTLTNGDSEEISLTYVSGAGSDTLVYQTSVCVPSTDTFTTGLVYTQPTNGIEDMAGNDLASFTGAGAKTVTNGSGQSCNLATSLFEHGESAPSGSTNASGNALNLGVKFQTSTAGTMTHCWFYKIAADTGTHTCTVYRVLDGSTVGTVDFADESESGWQDQAFASALNIAANEDYIVTVSHPTGNWTSNVDYFASTYTNGNLTATTAGTDYAGRYIYGASMAYPVNDSARNYWVDFTMSYAGAGGPWQCTVSRTGDGCMVTGSQVVTNGNTCSATVTLRNGWKATWGGTCPAGSETEGIYTTGNLSADCTLTAACTEQYILP
jgi:hypothetical protein